MSMHLGESQIAPGATGQEVKQLQEILYGGGYGNIAIDGIYGPETTSAVKSFQKSKGLVADGIVGPLTWDALKGRTPDVQPPGPRPMPIPTPEPRSNRNLLLVGLALTGVGFLLAKPR